MRGGGLEGVEREVDALTTAQPVVVATAGYHGNREETIIVHACTCTKKNN